MLHQNFVTLYFTKPRALGRYTARGQAMFTITNSKLKSFAPTWSRFHGFSLLFDNPGENLRDDGKYNTLTTRLEIEFYAALTQALARIGGSLLTNTYLFAPLPSNSYHVTAWDGINYENIADVHADYRQQAADFLAELPHSIAFATPFTELVNKSPLLQNQQMLTLCFDKLYIWGNNVLVAALRPAEDCIMQFDTLKQKRAAHNEKFAEEFGCSAFANYTPHVSLGYFANQESAQLASARLSEWRGEFTRIMDRQTLSVSSIRLFGFTDMATFVTSRP